MVSANDDFHDFVVAFADPLTRLAYLLTAGLGGRDGSAGDTPHDIDVARRRAAAALAHARRYWRDVRSTGAPEPLAVEALVSRLPRSWHRDKLDTESPVERAVGWVAASVDPPDSPPAPADPHAAFRRPTTPSPAPTPHPPAMPEAADVDVGKVREALWRAWRTLDARQRAPLLFADLSVAVPRLAGIELATSFASERRQLLLARQGVSRLRTALSRDPAMPPGVVPDPVAMLADVLGERAREFAAGSDPYPVVLGEVRRNRSRVGVTAAAVVVALAGGTVAAVEVSAPAHHAPSIAAADSPNAVATPKPEATARAGVSPSPIDAGPPPTAVAGPPTIELGADTRPVDWPVRGNLSTDQPLLANVLDAFYQAHGDLISGHAQALLAADTPWFRVVCVIAPSPVGVMQSWFYGPVGSTSLREGALSFGGKLTHDSVVASLLADQRGHSALAVIGPPEMTKVQLGNLFLSAPLDSADTVPNTDGIVVRDMTGVPDTALFLQVSIGSVTGWSGRVPSMTLRPTTTAADDALLVSAVTVERGNPDPAVLRKAFGSTLTQVPWPLGTSRSVVLWGGVDADGNRGVALRVASPGSPDLLVVAWSDDPQGHAEYRLAPGAPDFPRAFAYDSPDGARIGVLVPTGVTRVGLVVNGADLGTEPVDADGFASLLVGQQYGTLAEQSLTVDLFDAGNRQVQRVSLSPRA